MKLITALVLFVLAGVTVQAQRDTKDWIETQATIIEVRNKVRAKSTRAFAQVSYTTQSGEAYETEVELLALPLFGAMQSVNDKVTILYDPENPMLAQSISRSFLETYGMYILIGAGVVLSLYNLGKMMKRKGAS